MAGHLHTRLKSCLQTILDLEPQLEVLEQSVAIKADLGRLKHYLRQVDAMELAEADVYRLERVTEHFLGEVRLPLQRALGENTHTSRVRVLQ